MSGSGEQNLDWMIETGRWALVIFPHTTGTMFGAPILSYLAARKGDRSLLLVLPLLMSILPIGLIVRNPRSSVGPFRTVDIAGPWGFNSPFRAKPRRLFACCSSGSIPPIAGTYPVPANSAPMATATVASSDTTPKLMSDRTLRPVIGSRPRSTSPMGSSPRG